MVQLLALMLLLLLLLLPVSGEVPAHHVWAEPDLAPLICALGVSSVKGSQAQVKSLRAPKSNYSAQLLV